MTRREIVDRLECEAKRRAAMQAEIARPWLCDAEPGINELPDGGPRMLAHALLLCALVVVLVGLACRAWLVEERISERTYCQQLALVQGAQMPDYCGEGTK